MKRSLKEILVDVRSCCHHGHGAALFADGDVYQAVSSNDVLAREDGEGGWEYRIAYIDDPDITEVELGNILSDHENF